MTSQPVQSIVRQRAAAGVAFLSAAQAVVVVSGYAFHVVASRTLGSASYGTLVVALSIAAWAKILGVSVFIPGLCKIVSEDHRRLAAGLATGGRMNLLTSLGVAALLLAASPLLGRALGDTDLVPLLIVAAIELPLFAAYLLSRQLLTALRRYGRAACVLAVYGLGRGLMGCTIILVGWGAIGGMAGVAAGAAGAGLLGMLWVLRERDSLVPSSCPDMVSRLFAWAAATLPTGLGMVTLLSLDLWLLKALTANPADTGSYGAAFAVSRLPDFLVQGLTGATFARVSGALGQDEPELARSVARESMRYLFVVFVPICALIAASADDIMGTAFGQAYRGGAGALSLLIVSVAFGAAVKLTFVLLAACDRPGLRVVLVAAMLPLSGGLSIWLIPRFGPVGAASASLVTMAIGAVAGAIAVARHLGVPPPLGAAVRCGTAGLLVFAAGRCWAGSGWLLPAKLAALGSAYLVLLVLMRELRAQDINSLKAVFRNAGPTPVVERSASGAEHDNRTGEA